MVEQELLSAWKPERDGPAGHKLTAWAVLPQEERREGPTSGHFIGPTLGVVPPFERAQPIPGWSGLLSNGDGTFTAMPDNGFGSKGNSGDYVLGLYTVDPDFKRWGDGTTEAGPIVNEAFTAFHDKKGLLKNGKGVDLTTTS